MWVEARINSLELHKALEHQSTAHQQDYGQGHFNNYQHATDATTALAD